jgi:hypothetical protein
MPLEIGQRSFTTACKAASTPGVAMIRPGLKRTVVIVSSPMLSGRTANTQFGSSLLAHLAQHAQCARPGRLLLSGTDRIGNMVLPQVDQLKDYGLNRFPIIRHPKAGITHFQPAEALDRDIAAQFLNNERQFSPDRSHLTSTGSGTQSASNGIA